MEKSKIELVKANLIDLEKIQVIGRETFYQTFSDTNDELDMKKYLEESFSSEKILMELKNTHSEFYLAYFDNKVVGYLKINYADAQTELKDTKALEIERIYVLKDFHGQKVGQILYNKALERAKQLNLEYLWLGVYENNLRAVNFYKKNGFTAFGKHIFKLGDDEQTDIMMKVSI